MEEFDQGDKSVEPTAKWKKRAKTDGAALDAVEDVASNSPASRRSLNQGAPAQSNERELLLGKELAAAFQDKDVHPVFIFGSKGSGKTSLIASILKYMRDREEAAATISLAESVYPENEAFWTASLSWSRDLFYKKVLDYVDQIAPQTTQEEQPFFVPVKVTRSNGEEILFAFLEGKGEWYQPDQSAEVPFKRFKGLLHGMLQHYSGSGTFIYVAPFATESSYEGPKSEHLRQSDLGLLGVLNEYLQIRKAYAHNDRHMFVVTKWDIFCESVISPSFIDPTDDEIQSVVRERYPLAWKCYLNAAMSSDQQNRTFSAYCAGLIAGRDVIVPSEGDSENVAYYSRKLWDWLYENATGRVLYPDVRPKPPGLLDRLLTWLRS